MAPDTEVRALTATVLDEDGEAVPGLGVEDVALSENGVVRDITAFKLDERPLTVAVIVDSSASVRGEYRLNVVEAISSLVSRLPSGTSYAASSSVVAWSRCWLRCSPSPSATSGS